MKEVTEDEFNAWCFENLDNYDIKSTLPRLTSVQKFTPESWKQGKAATSKEVFDKFTEYRKDSMYNSTNPKRLEIAEKALKEFLEID